ncbi:type 2 isopentenyl-diphosphate Delta-isomerase [Lentilactobacillus sp. Marseille-Q4993]|uniref:type 2 isopentenyl-diphosphate Delta-isomerase n=1 Tax=Lentilactobacillus sp. Marseille-Q4993 TaxID=3039492 RepID=UPI0024BD3EC3|nr:type 2 isopentenyl-diphosphate Delta-isomerase [Lentilactobacillus sp. Marseille-Q4993]
MVSKQSHRKDEHLSLSEKYWGTHKSSFNHIRLMPKTLPSFSRTDIDYSTSIAGIKLSVPFYIEAITGGSDRSTKINKKLATVASKTGLAMAVGSQSIALKEPEQVESFEVVRQLNPNGTIIANIGANHGATDAAKAIEMIKADAIELHLNVAQEVIMPEGDHRFDYQPSIEEVVKSVSVPVIAKEVGFGIDHQSAARLVSIGVNAINVGGNGGTNFAEIENFRRRDKSMSYLHDWGLSTVESMLLLKPLASNVSLISTGGITTPLEVVKAMALGANAIGMAGYFAHLAINYDTEEIVEIVEQFKEQVKNCMFLAGFQTIADAHQNATLIYDNHINNFINQFENK